MATSVPTRMNLASSKSRLSYLIICNCAMQLIPTYYTWQIAFSSWAHHLWRSWMTFGPSRSPILNLANYGQAHLICRVTRSLAWSSMHWTFILHHWKCIIKKKLEICISFWLFTADWKFSPCIDKTGRTPSALWKCCVREVIRATGRRWFWILSWDRPLNITWTDV